MSLVGIKYSMCCLICDVIALLEALILENKVYMI